LHDRPACRAMGRSGRRRAERYRWVRIAAETLGELSRLAAQRTAGRSDGLVTEGARP
jgi:hypothetical protein